MRLHRKIIAIYILFIILSIFCLNKPCFSQFLPWSWPPAYPFPSIVQFHLYNGPNPSYFPRTGQPFSSGWPGYLPPSGLPAFNRTFPWSWQPFRPFSGINQFPVSNLYNWPQSGFFPSLGQFQSSGWPIYSLPPAISAPNEITLIHIGDLHGHLIPRAHLRSDTDGRMRGGLARVFTKIEEIRRRHPNSTLLVNCGDTIQGSAEVLYTEGSAIVNILASFEIDAFAPGNWDYLYGPRRFRELFAEPNPIAPWTALASNLYYNGEPYTAAIGQRVLPPFKIKYVNGLKIGILGFTTHVMPRVLPEYLGRGFGFTQGDAELAEFIPLLREQERVDLLVMISELGLARNIRLAEIHPGIDVILSSDLHEETIEPVVTSTGTIIVEEGVDGTLVGELTVITEGGRVADWRFKQHIINSQIPDNLQILSKVTQVRRSFVSGPDFRIHINPLNGTTLKIPIDTVVGYASIGLHRSNFSQEPMPAVVEGSSHDFISDTFRTIAQTDIGVINGFRFGTHVPPGPIKLEDIYHFIPFGPSIARGEVSGLQIKTQLENSTNSTLSPDLTQQGGGWLLAWSGLNYELDPYALYGQRAQNIMVFRMATNAWEPLNTGAIYTYASTYFSEEPNLIDKVPANNVQPLIGKDGIPMDATEVVVEYLKTNMANPRLNRIRLLQPLPPYRYRNPEAQPLWGARP